MKTALFHNFTTKEFVGYWNGRAHKFPAGDKKYMPDYLAIHFGKHLTNRVLTEKGLELYCSPKKPQEVAQFWDIFSKACIIEEGAEELDQASIEIEMANRGRGLPVSSSIDVKPTKPIDPYDASSQEVTGPGSKPQVIGADLGDDEEFEDNDGGDDTNSN